MRKGGKTKDKEENVISERKKKKKSKNKRGMVGMKIPEERNEFRLKRAEGERRRIYGSLTAIIQGP